MEERWTQVDRYVEDLFGLDDAALTAAVESSRKEGLPQIQVTPALGQLLSVLARAIGAKKILEIGTLGGYSAIWLARGLAAGGRLTTLEIDAHHADVARANLERAGLGDRVDVVVAPARESLERMIGAGEPPFDMVFIDADKDGYPDYLERSLRLSHAGTMIVADNVVRGGEIITPGHPDPRVAGIQRFNEMLAHDSRLSATILQTVGDKGYDGIAVALVLGTINP